MKDYSEMVKKAEPRKPVPMGAVKVKPKPKVRQK